MILINAALRLQLPFHYKTLWSICGSDCVRYEGNWMAQILGYTLKNWLLNMHGWPCLSNQPLYGALLICCLGTYSWNSVGMSFVTLLAYLPIPWDFKLAVGKSTICFMTNVTCMMSGMKSMSFLMPLLRNVLFEKGICRTFRRTICLLYWY